MVGPVGEAEELVGLVCANAEYAINTNAAVAVSIVRMVIPCLNKPRAWPIPGFFQATYVALNAA
jgi:hypothetical protein